MIAFPLLLLAALALPAAAYPVYGTKRYGGGSFPMMQRPYYDLAPYSDDYYQENWYPRTSKYEVYQAVLPYYYARPYNYYEEEEEEALQEAEREQREEAQPIGHELLYEHEDADNDDANAAFLQNLIVSQLYKDDGAYYGKWEEEAAPRRKVDEDVAELKQLAQNDLHWYGQKRELPSSTVGPKREARGQKEEVLMRPATPVRHAFVPEEGKRSPSVYDTIKHMLDMEKSLKNVNEVRPRMKKRIVTSERDLSRQLTVLKKPVQ